MSIIFIGGLGFIGKHSETSLPIKNQAVMQIINLGAGLPDSALKMKSYFESFTRQSILVQIAKDRDGDEPIYNLRANRAKSILGSYAKHSFEEMRKWSWCCQERYQELNSLGH